MPTWIFSRASQRLRVQRRETPEGPTLVVNTDGEERTYVFEDLDKLKRFQEDMERFLLQTGWVFDEFLPDRRTGRDRRGFPRLGNDRRRWWTDSRTLVPTRGKRSRDED